MPIKTFGLAVPAAVGGYLLGLFSGMLLIETFPSNTHDKSIAAAMTGAFAFEPLVAVIAVAITLVFRSRRSINDKD